jgi:N6-adenosine-specific RNA methylase IME4
MSDAFRDLDALLRTGRKFGSILADPPWSFETYSDKGKGRSADRHYSCMSLDDIKRLPIGKLAAPDCVLFLWGISTMVPDALDVIRAWGFTCKTKAFNWVKSTKHGKLHSGMGFWTRANAEDVWLATRGAPKRIAANVHQVVMEPVGEHSVKPEEVAQRIERLVAGPYLELFARRRRPRWTCWGDEVPIDGAQTATKTPIARLATAAEPVERLVRTASPKVIVHVYADGTCVWRYAADRTFRHEGADEKLAEVRQQIKEARELDAILPPMGASTT